jgi:TRAP-type uncharacterized transport system substrate-binding protein
MLLLIMMKTKGNSMFKTMITAAALALVSTASMAEQITINLCTGGEGKPYHQTGNYIESFLKDSKNIKVNVITTKGTWDNIERTTSVTATPETIASGESCQAFIGQPDGAVQLKRKNPAVASQLSIIGQGPVEYLHVLCGKDSGIEDLYQLAGDNSKSVALGASGSGAWLIWQNFIAEDAGYAEVQVSAKDGALAMSDVANGTTSCMIVPAALGNATVLQADTDFGDSLVLAGANDKDFNDATNIDGKALYRWETIPSGTYTTYLQAGWFTSTDTIAWQAGIYVNADFFSGKDAALSDLITAVAKAKPAIKKTFGTLE